MVLFASSLATDTSSGSDDDDDEVLAGFVCGDDIEGDAPYERAEQRRSQSRSMDGHAAPIFNLKDEESAALVPRSYSDTKAQEAAFLLTPERAYVYYLLMALNFTTRGCIAVYETQSSRIFLDTFHLSYIELGALVSTSGEWVGCLTLSCTCFTIILLPRRFGRNADAGVL